MSRTPRVLFLAWVLIAAPALSQPETTSLPPAEEYLEAWSVLDRAALVGAVLERNPELEAARQAWRAALEGVVQAGSLEDPMVSYSVAPASLGSGGSSFGQVLRFSQRLPFPGRLRLQGEVARATAETAAQELETIRLNLALMASLLFDDLYVIHRGLEINREHIALLEDFQRIATARYAAGLVPQQDPIQAEVELAHLVHREVILTTARRTTMARLNALLHRPPRSAPPPPPTTLPPLSSSPSPLDGEEAVLSRPEIAALEAEIAGRSQGVDLASLGRYPDFEAAASYNSMWAAPEHQWEVGVTINVPIQRRRIRAEIAEAEARLASTRAERERVADLIRAEVDQAEARLAEAHHVVELYRSRLLPASRDQVQAALAGFRTGRNSFLVLIEAERNLRTVKLEYEEALADGYRRRAELDRALGRMPLSVHARTIDRDVIGLATLKGES
jgi:outer membrane protein TolC